MQLYTSPFYISFQITNNLIMFNLQKFSTDVVYISLPYKYSAPKEKTTKT